MAIREAYSRLSLCRDVLSMAPCPVPRCAIWGSPVPAVPRQRSGHRGQGGGGPHGQAGR